MAGVGEALRREIAGLVLVGGLLWGFVGWAWLVADRKILSNRSEQAKFVIDHGRILAICDVFCLCPGSLRC